MTAIYKRELSSYFNSMIGYVFIAALVCFTGIYFMAYNLYNGLPDFSYALMSLMNILMFTVPILTMRSMAEDRRGRTDQLLLTAPVPLWAVVLGKYLAMVTVLFVPVFLAAFCPLIIAANGEAHLFSDYASLLAFFLMGCVFLAIGMFISSLTESQGMAAGICVVVMLFCYYSASLADYISSTAFNVAALLVLSALLALIVRKLTRSDAAGLIILALCVAAVVITWLVSPTSLETLLPDLMNQLSLFERFYTFVNGVFDVTAIVYYISVAVFFLFLCVQSWEKKRYNG